jgi:thioredoxin 1
MVGRSIHEAGARPAYASSLEGHVPTQDSRPLLVFFTSRRSGPARRMESLLAHIARKERDALRVKKVDVDERPDVAMRFSIVEVPSLALVKGKRIVARLEGRSTQPTIESMLDSHMERERPAVA